MEKEELLKIYKYIKICLYYHHGGKLEKRKLFKDMQHDIFLSIVDRPDVTAFTPGVKRLIFLYAQYNPLFLKYKKYSSDKEQVLLDVEGEVIDDPGISYFPNGDTLYDLDLLDSIESKKKPSKVFHNTKPILVSYLNGGQEVYNGVTEFSKKFGCHTTTVTKWIREGVKPRKGNKDMRPSIQKKAQDRYGHIKKVEYLVP